MTTSLIPQELLPDFMSRRAVGTVLKIHFTALDDGVGRRGCSSCAPTADPFFAKLRCFLQFTGYFIDTYCVNHLGEQGRAVDRLCWPSGVPWFLPPKPGLVAAVTSDWLPMTSGDDQPRPASWCARRHFLFCPLGWHIGRVGNALPSRSAPPRPVGLVDETQPAMRLPRQLVYVYSWKLPSDCWSGRRSVRCHESGNLSCRLAKRLVDLFLANRARCL